MERLVVTAQDEADRERVRQSERTVDNLKRLYAVLFSISFGIVALGAFRKLEAYENPETAYAWGSFFVQTELTAAFVMTAGLFYYQGDRFLDVAYARAPLRPVAAFDFGIDYLVNVFTMTPFYLMANALAGDVIAKTGFLWFFLSYCFLILLGLSLLLVREASRIVRGVEVPVPLGALQAFWMMMNSGILIVAVGMFVWLRARGDACPFKPHDDRWPVFVFLFGILIFARDWIDFTRAWPVLYPVDPGTPAGRMRFPLSVMQSDGRVVLGKLLGAALIISLVALVVYFDLWRIPDLARSCAN